MVRLRSELLNVRKTLSDLHELFYFSLTEGDWNIYLKRGNERERETFLFTKEKYPKSKPS